MPVSTAASSRLPPPAAIAPAAPAPPSHFLDSFDGWDLVRRHLDEVELAPIAQMTDRGVRVDHGVYTRTFSALCNQPKPGGPDKIQVAMQAIGSDIAARVAAEGGTTLCKELGWVERPGKWVYNVRGRRGVVTVAIIKKLPTDFRESLGIHDGQKHAEGDLVPAPAKGDTGYFLLASADVANEWARWKELHDAGEFADQQSGPDKGVSGAWWNPGWIPFASNGGGDLLCIDMAPAEGGAAGQVITMNHEVSKRECLAPSFSQWLADLVLAVQGPL